MSIEVLEPGVLTTVQDPVGRRSWRHLGVPVGGAADPYSARLANRLVGNPDGGALLEMTLVGATLRFGAAAIVALTGGLEAAIGGIALPRGRARRVRAGAVLAVREGRGARGYLAVGGGIDVPVTLGSFSTELRSGFGGLEGRALRAGDRLETGTTPGGPMRRNGTLRDSEAPVRIVDGPHPDGVLGALTGQAFTVGQQADRIGVRTSEGIEGGGEVPSMGLPLGAIQLPPDGRPIVMLADRPVTGGYRVPAVVIGADIGRVAQLRPGDRMRFASVSLAEARAAWAEAEAELAALEPLSVDEREDGELGWIGSHS